MHVIDVSALSNCVTIVDSIIYYTSISMYKISEYASVHAYIYVRCKLPNACSTCYSPLGPENADCPSETDATWGVTWSDAQFGKVDVQRCPGGLNETVGKCSPAFFCWCCIAAAFVTGIDSPCNSYMLTNHGIMLSLHWAHILTV